MRIDDWDIPVNAHEAYSLSWQAFLNQTDEEAALDEMERFLEDDDHEFVERDPNAVPTPSRN